MSSDHNRADDMSRFWHTLHSDNQTLSLELPHHIQLTIKREDLIHPLISGNKYRKLKYNLLAAQQQQQRTLLTFGGAYSNHIAAVAAAGKQFGFQTIGIIRGDELAQQTHLNPTLLTAQANGMQLHFVSRADYKNKHSDAFIAQLEQRFGAFYLIPEGGSNALAVQGCTEILTPQDTQDFDFICCAVGTGGTVAGLILSAATTQQVLGFSVLKGDFLLDEIKQWLPTHSIQQANWNLNGDYHCGGYAKTTPELNQFVAQFRQRTGIPIEPIYTGKMLMGIFDLIEQGYFPAHSHILAIHTGGLQALQT